MHNFPFQDSPNVRLRQAELYVQLVPTYEGLLYFANEMMNKPLALREIKNHNSRISV